MGNHSKIGDRCDSNAVTPAYHLGYADGLSGADPGDWNDDYADGYREGCDARNAPGGTPAQLRRSIADHRMAALRTRVEELGLNPDEIVELDLTSNAVPESKPHGRPRTTIDRSSVGYGRGAA